MIRKHVCFTLVVALLTPFQSVSGLGLESIGNEPLGEANYTNWPGAARVVNHSSRVYQFWDNGSEHSYFQGDSAALNEVLVHFAAVGMPVHEVIVLPGPAVARAFDGKAIPYDWEFHVLGGISDFFCKEETETQVYIDYPTLTIYMGGGNVVLDALAIPEGVTLLQLDDLRARYHKGLKSEFGAVRRAAAGKLSIVDPYSADSLVRIAELFNETDTGEETTVVQAGPRPDGSGSNTPTKLLQRMGKPDPGILARLLVRFGKPARPILVKQLERGDLDAETRKHLKKSIQTIDDTSADPDAETQYQAHVAEIDTFVSRYMIAR